MVSVISGVIGGQADLTKPHYLMADANNLTQTSDTQIVSAFSNVYGHLVGSAAAQTMLFDDIKVDSEEHIKTLLKVAVSK